MKIKHQHCLYVVDHIYIDQATTNLYHLFLHCERCGKAIKLCVKTENDVVNWLSGKKTCENCDLYFKAMTKEEMKKGGNNNDVR